MPMGSAFDTLFTAIGSPLLVDEFGETVVRNPLGVAAGAENVTGVIVTRELEAFVEEAPTGKKITSFRHITIPTSQTWSTEDTWTIDGLTWSTLGQTQQSADRRTLTVQHVQMKTLKH